MGMLTADCHTWARSRVCHSLDAVCAWHVILVHTRTLRHTHAHTHTHNAQLHTQCATLAGQPGSRLARHRPGTGWRRAGAVPYRVEAGCETRKKKSINVAGKYQPCLCPASLNIIIIHRRKAPVPPDHQYHQTTGTTKSPVP